MAWLASIAASLGSSLITVVLGWLSKLISDLIRAYVEEKKIEAINAANKKLLEEAKSAEEIDHAAEELARHAGRHP